MPRPPKPLIVNGVEYPSIKAASLALGRSTANIIYHMRRGTLDKLASEAPVHSGLALPIEGYPSQKAYAAAKGVTPSAVSKAKRRSAASV